MKRKNNTLTIGLVTYNGEKTLQNSLESLRKQTYKDFKLIISDNNSNDNTEKICKKYKKKFKNLNYIKRNKNFGPINNFWSVLERANTEFFMWASDDDMWDKDFIKILLKELINDKNLDLVYCWTNVFDPSTRKTHKFFRPKNYYNKSKEFRYLQELIKPCVNKYYGIYRTQKLKQFNYKKYYLHDYQDTLLIDYFNLNFNIKIVEKKLFNYAEKIGSIRKSLDKNFQYKYFFKFNHFKYFYYSNILLFKSKFSFIIKLIYFLVFTIMFYGRKILSKFL